jgi:hypothetical protein
MVGIFLGQRVDPAWTVAKLGRNPRNVCHHIAPLNSMTETGSAFGSTVRGAFDANPIIQATMTQATVNDVSRYCWRGSFIALLRCIWFKRRIARTVPSLFLPVVPNKNPLKVLLPAPQTIQAQFSARQTARCHRNNRNQNCVPNILFRAASALRDPQPLWGQNKKRSHLSLRSFWLELLGDWCGDFDGGFCGLVPQNVLVNRQAALSHQTDGAKVKARRQSTPRLPVGNSRDAYAKGLRRRIRAAKNVNEFVHCLDHDRVIVQAA